VQGRDADRDAIDDKSGALDVTVAPHQGDGFARADLLASAVVVQIGSPLISLVRRPLAFWIMNTSAGFLNRHTSEVVTSIVSIAVTFVVAWAFWKIRQPKRIMWVLEINTPVVSEEAKIAASKLRVYWEENPDDAAAKLEDPRLVLLRVVNAGMKDIEHDDFKTGTEGEQEWTPISISLTGGKIYAADVIEKSEGVVAAPEDFARGSASSVSFSSGLMRKGEWFKVQLVVDGAAEQLRVDARFQGQTRKPKELDIKEWRKRKFAWGLSGFLTLICLASLGIARAVYTKPVPTTEYHVQGSYSWWIALTGYSFELAIISTGFAIMTQIRSWVRRKWQERKRDRLATQKVRAGT
jgi:hypothetical protein